ncbi:hypothetical protein Y032_0581g268 [Ancylostoma ceylanicum]|uniref:Uncharacterized protein n=1 Tax=Ancylostoma ceylanicum TaxID=53326 RepID=A0A016WN92_9BILA|nr:hypothetical protein Y032_0581g268 [Ancylostoma ceylanicum]
MSDLLCVRGTGNRAIVGRQSLAKPRVAHASHALTETPSLSSFRFRASHFFRNGPSHVSLPWSAMPANSPPPRRCPINGASYGILLTTVVISISIGDFKTAKVE